MGPGSGNALTRKAFSAARRVYGERAGMSLPPMALSKLENEARRLLLERRHSLWPDLARVEPTPLPDPAGRLGEAQRSELAAIDEALHRIAEGRYGECLACGGPLGLQRIRAIPEARYCIACSTGRGAA